VRGSLTPALILDGLCLHVLSSFQRTGTPGDPAGTRVSLPVTTARGKPYEFTTIRAGLSSRRQRSIGHLRPRRHRRSPLNLRGSPANWLNPNEFLEGRRKRLLLTRPGGSCLDFLEYVPAPAMSTPGFRPKAHGPWPKTTNP
jgi:hypothetical protein